MPDQATTSAPTDRTRLDSSIPVRFDATTLEVIRRHADADHRTVSAWIRHVVQLHLHDAQGLAQP